MKAKNIIRGLFALSLCCVTFIYFWRGDHGLRTYLNLKKEVLQEASTVKALEDNINGIKQKIAQWNTDSFEKEKIARQDLSMSYTNELVYLTPKSK